MKTKTIAVLEIAIVLCSVFLVALPGIAAAASEIYEPGPLDVFGNANEDDTIDMRDTTYIKLAIFGKKPKTDLADANNDGKVSMLDVGQTKLIILGKEKKLTFIDILGEAETVNKPINRIVHLGVRGLEVTRILGARDKLVAVATTYHAKQPRFYPVIGKLPVVGRDEDCDFEKVLSLKPDAVQPNLEMRMNIVPLSEGLKKKRMHQEKLPGIPLICLNMRDQDVLAQNVRTYGYILDREDEAEEFIAWFEGYFNLFTSRTEGLPKDERPRFYFEYSGSPYKPYTSGNRAAMVFILAGGRNIVDELVGPDDPLWGGWLDVDPEWVIEQNPDFIFIGYSSAASGYATDDSSEIAANWQGMLNRPELAHVTAVKNRHVYTLSFHLLGGAGNNVAGSAYAAKVMYPDLFKDLDPQAIHQEYIDEYVRVDFDVRKEGVFVYPPFGEWPV